MMRTVILFFFVAFGAFFAAAADLAPLKPVHPFSFRVTLRPGACDILMSMMPY